MANIELGANIHYPEQYGMVKKRHIVSKKNPDKSYENGTTTTPTPVLGKNENCQKRPGSLQLRSQIGSKIEDKEIEPQKVQGKQKLLSFLRLFVDLFVCCLTKSKSFRGITKF